ncbi:hypothetical protein HLV37_02525 [Eggerthellaceae bacterium zg-1084]|uniref:hypothetical protein n=1 Tax=Berryella wangjianweii TaxID=2734634 RepID=UPI001556C5C0|nr:hypothetical protein [Berryella wangjianweii]NPD30754.1 hypothetical protein [Berryella wangjianweii]NPD32027.1 hypothetical protein [Eggerthellaceae bacterium zg-997]
MNRSTIIGYAVTALAIVALCVLWANHVLPNELYPVGFAAVLVGYFMWVRKRNDRA